MKFLGKLKTRRKGFTLVECIVAMAVFSIMMMIVAQILYMTVTVDKRNNNTARDINAQAQIIAQGDIKNQESMRFKFNLPNKYTYTRSSYGYGYVADDYPLGVNDDYVKKEDSINGWVQAVDGDELEIVGLDDSSVRVYYVGEYDESVYDNENASKGDMKDVQDRLYYVSFETSSYEYSLIGRNFLNQQKNTAAWGNSATTLGDYWTHDAYNALGPADKLLFDKNRIKYFLDNSSTGYRGKVAETPVAVGNFISSLNGGVQDTAEASQVSIDVSVTAGSIDTKGGYFDVHVTFENLDTVNSSGNNVVGVYIPEQYNFDSRMEGAFIGGIGNCRGGVAIRPLYSSSDSPNSGKGNIFLRFTKLRNVVNNYDSSANAYSDETGFVTGDKSQAEAFFTIYIPSNGKSAADLTKYVEKMFQCDGVNTGPKTSYNHVEPLSAKLASSTP